jgi:hypothetical protein
MKYQISTAQNFTHDFRTLEYYGPLRVNKIINESVMRYFVRITPLILECASCVWVGMVATASGSGSEVYCRLL